MNDLFLLCLIVSAASLVAIAVGVFEIRDALLKREPDSDPHADSFFRPPKGDFKK